MRAMAIDPGDKRWGLAVSDEDGELAHPRPAIVLRERAAATAVAEALTALATVADEEAVAVIVVGLPLELSGREGPAAKKARALAAEIARRSRRSVALWDERLSSVAASRSLRAQGLSAKQQRGKVDSVAAMLLLQSFLDAAPAVRARSIVHPAEPAG
ncbi:MAG: Holliday junction resolvase RuvX [Sandaracinaceae bacterium]